MKKEMKKVTIYTDGASKGNPGKGGYGAVLLFTDDDGKIIKKTISAGYKNTTNNRMEIMAVLKSLQSLYAPCEVELYSDSQYVVNTFNKKWINNWKNNGWKTRNGSPVKNKDLWILLIEQLKIHKVHFNWIKGHNDNEYNELCDKLATNAADNNAILEDKGE